MSFTLALQNVDNIKIIFSSYGEVNVYALRDIKKFELMTDFFFAEAKEESGYYCSFCETPVYFKDRHVLWEDHIYEPLLEWANANILPDNYLCIYEVRTHGSSWTKILPSTDIENDKDLEYRILCKPIINQERIDEKA